MKKIVVGVIIVMLGIFLLFRNLGYIPYEVSHWVFSWQSLLIAIGALLLFDRKADNKTAGVILVLVGTVFLIPKISFLDVSLNDMLVPAIVIIIGVLFIVWVTTKKNWWWKDHLKHHSSEWKECDYTKKSFSTMSDNGNGYMKREYVFDGSKEKWTYGKLRNVEIEAVFSGVELDFTQAELADDVKVAVHIKVKAVFSGVTLYVPDDWNIMIQKTGVFGGFVDQRPRNIKVDEEKRVILEVEAVFGGGEMRCYE